MKRLPLQSAVISALLLMATATMGSSRPRYSGTVRVLLHDKVASIDPLLEDDHPAARDRLAALTFETLTQIDPQGHVRPGLASSWHADATKRSWQFHLRLANFHDGSVVTAADVAASLGQSRNGWKYTATDRQTVSIETHAPVAHMPEMLALAKFAIVKRSDGPNGTLIGTGAFRLTEWTSGERAVFTAFEDHWAGRPFPDSIEFQMGATLRDQLLARQLGQYAAAEPALDQLRPLEQTNQLIVSSRPADLLAIVFLQPTAGGRRKPVDPRVREALADTLDRSAISNVLLQRHATPAGGVLPQWLTGYEFLFSSAPELDRARELRSDAAAYVIISPITLAYDFADPTAKLIAERIAVDARQAGITVQPYGEAHINSKSARATANADAVLVRLPLASLSPAVSLVEVGEEFGASNELTNAALAAEKPEDLYAAERKLLEDHRIVPVSHVSESVWLNNTVHNWQQLANGNWQLDQLWVEGGR